MTTDNIILNNKKNIIRPSSKVEECPDGHVCMNGSKCVVDDKTSDDGAETLYSCDCASAIQSQGNKGKKKHEKVQDSLKRLPSAASKSTLFPDQGNKKKKPRTSNDGDNEEEEEEEDAPTSFAGVSCEFRATQYCAYDSIFSPHHFCVNEGQCVDVVPEEHPRVRVGCICPDDFEGPHCEYVKGSSYSSSSSSSNPADLYSVTPPSSSKPINGGMSGATVLLAMLSIVALIAATSLFVLAVTRGVRQKRKQADAEIILAHSRAAALTEPGVEMKEVRNGVYQNPTVEATPPPPADESKQGPDPQSLTLV